MAKLSPAVISIPRPIGQDNNQLSIPKKNWKIITNHSHLCLSVQNLPRRSTSRRATRLPHNLQVSPAGSLSGAVPPRFGGPKIRRCLVGSEPPVMIMPNTYVSQRRSCLAVPSPVCNHSSCSCLSTFVRILRESGHPLVHGHQLSIVMHYSYKRRRVYKGSTRTISPALVDGLRPSRHRWA